MKITVVGCSGSVPGPESSASCYLIEHEGYRVVLDFGNGAFGALLKYYPLTEIDAIFVSHLHADHCIDLTAAIVGLRWGPERPEKKLRIIGVPGTRDRVEVAYDPMSRKLNLHELFDFSTPVAGELGPFRVDYAQMNHPIPTFAIDLSAGGKRLTYSADTGETGELIRLAQGSDLLLCEASFGPDDKYVPNLHLTGRQAGEHAAQAGVGSLVVTHVPPWGSPERNAEHAAEAFDGKIEIARPGAVWEL